MSASQPSQGPQPTLSDPATCYALAADTLHPTEHLKLAIVVSASFSSPSEAAPTTATSASVAPSDTSSQDEDCILAIISNVDAGWEQGALLVLKPRKNDGCKSASVRTLLPLVPGFRHDIVESGGDQDANDGDDKQKEGSAKEQAGAEPKEVGPKQSTDGTLQHFALQAGTAHFHGSTTDITGLQDLFTVIDTMVKVAQDRKGEKGSGEGASEETERRKEGGEYAWLSGYSDHPPAALTTPIFSRFSSSSFAPQPSTSSTSTSATTRAGSSNTTSGSLPGLTDNPTHPAADELKISIATWNINGQMPPTLENQDHAQSEGVTALAAWLRAQEESDIIVVGFQEFDLSSTSYLYYTPAREEAWTTAISRALGRRAREYTKLASRQLVGLMNMVFVRSSLLDCIQDMDTASVGVGFGGILANKGATGIRFRYIPRHAASSSTSSGEVHRGQTFCFVNAHLSAFEGPEALERRRWDMQEIMKRLHFDLPLEKGRIEGKEGIGKLVLTEDRGASSSGSEVAPLPPTLAAAVAQIAASPSELGASVKDMPEKEREGHRKWRRRWARERKQWLEERQKWIGHQKGWVDGKVDEGFDALDDNIAQWQKLGRSLRVELGILDHDLVFFSGDLNYRIDLNINETKKMLKKGNYSTLLKFDQLTAERSIGAVFKQGWEEGQINFPCTYKYDLGTVDTFDTSEKQRVPAWTDRVLWHIPVRVAPTHLMEKVASKEIDDDESDEEDAIPSSSLSREHVVKQVLYTSEMRCTISDHKPVLAVFFVKNLD